MRRGAYLLCAVALWISGCDGPSADSLSTTTQQPEIRIDTPGISCEQLTQVWQKRSDLTDEQVFASRVAERAIELLTEVQSNSDAQSCSDLIEAVRGTLPRTRPGNA